MIYYTLSKLHDWTIIQIVIRYWYFQNHPNLTLKRGPCAVAVIK